MRHKFSTSFYDNKGVLQCFRTWQDCQAAYLLQELSYLFE